MSVLPFIHNSVRSDLEFLLRARKKETKLRAMIW